MSETFQEFYAITFNIDTLFQDKLYFINKFTKLCYRNRAYKRQDPIGTNKLGLDRLRYQ